MALALPSHPDLERFRRDARRLLRAWRAHDPAAQRLVARHHPQSPVPSEARLADAHLVLARSYGFSSWPRLRAYLELAAPLTRRPDADLDAEEFLRLACLTYSSADDPERWVRAGQLADRTPASAERDIWTAAALADPAAVGRHLAADPALARAEGDPHRWVPLMYLTYSRVGRGDPVAAARLLLEAGADPNAGYLFAGLPTPFTLLTGCFGEGEQGPGRQPRHPQGEALARLLLEAGADPNDAQTLYNRMFNRDDRHLELLFAYGLGRGADGPWRRRLGEALESVPAMMARQVSWASEHGMTARLELLAAHGFRTGEVLEVTLSVFRAASAADVARLVAAGADVDERQGGHTALHHFAWIGDVELVRALLAAGADPTVLDDEHGTDAHAWAVHGRQPATAELLDPQ